jgi:uncharacterized membrane protein YgdD (TMEM256/DUF423 family)
MLRSQSCTSAIRRQFRTPWIAMGLTYGAALSALFAFFFTGRRDIVALFLTPIGGVVIAAWIALLARAREQLDADR